MRMTREEAIAYFKRCIYIYRAEGLCTEAEEMAIEALDQQPTDAVDRVTIKEYLESFGKVKIEQEPCDDCISRQAVLKAIDAKAWEFCDYLIREGRNDEQKPVSHFADNLRECVGEDLPPVTPQPKMGRWITLKDEYGDVTEAVCSCCDKNGNHKWAFCPNCGAKMPEVEE